MGIKFPTPLEDSDQQIPSSPGRQRCQMPGVCPGGGACWSFDLTDTLLNRVQPAKPRDKLKRSKNIVTSHHRLRSSFAVELFGIFILVIMYRISRVHVRNGRKNWESSWGAYSNISGKFEYLQRLCAINLHSISLVQICLRRCHGDLGISVFWVSLLILH